MGGGAREGAVRDGGPLRCGRLGHLVGGTEEEGDLGERREGGEVRGRYLVRRPWPYLCLARGLRQW